MYEIKSSLILQPGSAALTDGLAEVEKIVRLRPGRGAPLSQAKAALRPVGLFYLGVMVLTWAGNWPLMKLALGQVPPLMFVLLRLIGSLALIASGLLAAGQPLLPARGERSRLFWVGQLQVAGFLICSIISLPSCRPGGRLCSPIRCRSGRSRSACFCGRSRLTARSSAIGFAGLVLLMNPGLVDWGNGRVLAGNALLLVATIAWALGSCLYRQYSWRSLFWVQTFWQFAVSVLPVGVIVSPGRSVDGYGGRPSSSQSSPTTAS